MMGRILMTIVLLAGFSVTVGAQLYKDENAPTEKRIEDLLTRMTLEEKVWQTIQGTYGKNLNPNNVETSEQTVSPMVGSLIYRSISPVFRNRIQRKAMEESRLGIPVLFGFDVIHGFRTIFPVPLGQSCSWNVELVRRSCQIAAQESKLSGVDWTFSPMIDVARDSRWGRVSEGYGEDAYANSVFGVAAVQGYQGERLDDKYSIAACLKHYVGYSLSEGGRDYHYSDVSGQTLWETFMPPYEAGVAAGAATVMSAFNDITGIPASANYYTLTDVLKKQWKHAGFVVSDWGSVKNLVPQGVAADEKEACLKAFTAGVEMDMVDNIYLNHLPQLVGEGKVTTEQLDEAVRRILRVKFQLGLFDKPYTEELPENTRYLQQESLETARQLAAESMVLLKNKGNILPVAKKTRIAVIGPAADDRDAIMGTWSGQGELNDVITLLDGLKSVFSGLAYSKGSDFDGTDRSGFATACKTVRSADVVILCLGERANWSGENGSRSTLALPPIQEELAEAIRREGKPVILVIASGRPVELARLEPLADGIIEIWQPGIMGGVALADIVSGKTNPSGRLSITFPYTTGQQPAYYNQRQSARPKSGIYQDIPDKPLFEFGAGLSYTTFEYGDITLSSSTFLKTDTIVASITVSNSGDRNGDETVLWFISDPVASISRPVKELKFFEKRNIPASGHVTYTFNLVPERDLSFPDANGKKYLESGDYYLTVKDKKIKFVLK